MSISAGLSGMSKSLSFDNGENKVNIVFMSVRLSLMVVLPSVVPVIMAVSSPSCPFANGAIWS
jgi:hypothetical protein